MLIRQWLDRKRKVGKDLEITIPSKNKKKRWRRKERDISSFVSHFTECDGTDNTHACAGFCEFCTPSIPSNFTLMETKFHKLKPEIPQPEYIMQITYVDFHNLHNPKLRIPFPLKIYIGCLSEDRVPLGHMVKGFERAFEIEWPGETSQEMAIVEA